MGAGGNAGNQSAIKVIRGLATGSMRPTGAGVRRAMAQQLAVGLMLGAGLAAGGWLRVYVTNGNALNATAISISLFLIVVCSVVAGTGECQLVGVKGTLLHCRCRCATEANSMFHAPLAHPKLPCQGASLDGWDEVTWLTQRLLCLLLAAGLPFALARAGIDPANAGTSIQVHAGCMPQAACRRLLVAPLAVMHFRRYSAIAPRMRPPAHPPSAGPPCQVIMDVSGVLITCATCHLVLDQLAAGLTATS